MNEGTKLKSWQKISEYSRLMVECKRVSETLGAGDAEMKEYLSGVAKTLEKAISKEV